MEAAIWGFIGTIVGAFASLITTILATRNSAWLHKQAVDQEKEERKHAFQRETLIDLQDVTHDLMRLITQGHLEDVRAHQEGGAWGENFLSSEVNQGQRLARRKLIILIERIANDELRDHLRKVNSVLPNSAYKLSISEAEEQLHNAAREVMDVMEHIGKVLRAQY